MGLQTEGPVLVRRAYKECCDFHEARFFNVNVIRKHAGNWFAGRSNAPDLQNCMLKKRNRAKGDTCGILPEIACQRQVNNFCVY